MLPVKLQAAVTALHLHMTENPHSELTEKDLQELARLGANLVNYVSAQCDDASDRADYLDDVRATTPETFGQLLMNSLEEPLTGEEKIFWATVADYIGPDWIERLRSRANFMRIVSNFKETNQ